MNSISKKRTFIIGVGMTNFIRPGHRKNWDYPDMVVEAVTPEICVPTSSEEKIKANDNVSKNDIAMQRKLFIRKTLSGNSTRASEAFKYLYSMVKPEIPPLPLKSVNAALDDAKLSYSDIQIAAVGYLFGETCSAQRALYPLGLTGIPIYNVHNSGASGGTALHLVKGILESDTVDCALAVGFEKMKQTPMDEAFHVRDRAIPTEFHQQVMQQTYGIGTAPIAVQMFANAGREHMKKYGTQPEHFAKITCKSRQHSMNDPHCEFHEELTVEEILGSKMIYYPLTKQQCCPIADGSAAALLCNERFLNAHPHLRAQAVEILGIEMMSDVASSFELSDIKIVGFDITKLAAEKLYAKSGIGIDKVDVIELHDCFSTYELIIYEALGMCEIGQGSKIVDNGDNTYGGKWVVNPSGGLLSKGHPIGATGVAQCVELAWQLRGKADKRQVPNAKVALQHNIGLGGAVVVAMYKLAHPELSMSKL